MKSKLKNRRFSCIFTLLAAAVLAWAVSCRSEPGPKPARQKPGKTDTASLLLRISELQAKGDYEGALALFDAIDPRDGAAKEIRLLKASTCLSAGKISEGSSIAKDILAGEPEDVPALLVLAAAEEASGRTKEQKALLERILKLENANVPALVSMGNLLVRNNSVRLAGPYYDRARAAEPDNGEALLGRAWVYRNNRDSKNAEALLNRAVTLYPAWAMPLHERGRLYKSAGFPREALADLDKAKALEPDNYFIACDRGDALADMNRKSEALAEFERAVKIDPEYFLAYVYSAGIKDELGDYNGAEQDYEKLSLLNPDYYFAFEGLGMHLMRRGDWLAAKDAFVEAYKRAKTDEGTYALLAAVNWMRGGKLQDPRLLLEDVLRKVQRDSLEYWMLRLYHDLVGDGDIAIRIDREKNGIQKARMLYYLANYYDIRGNKRLADRYFLQVRELNVKGIPEWRLNEWALEERGLALKVN
ncbi:MAG: tetratricopeptide repeat protein [Spirochaetaceae bacterium]|jgi:tetratricopeptide (TPR) repeat protein|nr:tetratricopeptide repeat protein [Spirochaetaceae bacterium]